MTVANQNLPPLYRGTDGAFVFTCPTTVADASWTTLLTLKNATGGAFTFSGTGPTTNQLTFAFARAGTLLIPAGLYQFDVARTDSGANDELANGYISVSSTIRDP